MANWKLRINIAKEMNNLKNLTDDLDDSYVFEGDTEAKYIELAKELEAKIKSHEVDIKRITEDDGTFEDLERELEDFVMSYDIENSNYNLENIYSICDVARIWLEQKLV